MDVVGWQGSLGMSLAGSLLRPQLLELLLPLCCSCHHHCHLKTEGRTVAMALHAMAGWDRAASQTASVKQGLLIPLPQTLDVDVA